MSPRILPALAMAIAVIAGCSEPSPPGPDAGDASVCSACAANQTCVSNVCKYRCETDRDCLRIDARIARCTAGLCEAPK